MICTAHLKQFMYLYIILNEEKSLGCVMSVVLSCICIKSTLWLLNSWNYFTANIPVYLEVLTFKVVLLSSYTLNPGMLPLLERFTEVLWHNNLQPCLHIFFLTSLISQNPHPFKVDLNSGKRQPLGPNLFRKGMFQPNSRFCAMNCWAEGVLSAGARP
jgi:hypothetical protein